MSTQDQSSASLPAKFPRRDELSICFAHVAYPLAEIFENRATGLGHYQVWKRDELADKIRAAHVLVISGFWRNELLDNAPNLRFIQSVGAGYDQFPLEILRRRGIRLASAKGVNLNA